MTQGSTMNPNIPAAVSAATVERSNIVAIWRTQNEHGSRDHAIYALARLIHSAQNSKTEGYDSTEEFKLAALKKMVRTFGPVTKPSKLNNGRRAFGELLYQLERLQSFGGETRLGTVGEREIARWNFTSEQAVDIAYLATSLFFEARSAGPEGLLKFAAPPPPPRVKKPYVRPTT